MYYLKKIKMMNYKKLRVLKRKKVNNEPIILEIEESGVYLTLNGKPNFNNVVDYILEKVRI